MDGLERSSLDVKHELSCALLASSFACVTCSPRHQKSTCFPCLLWSIVENGKLILGFDWFLNRNPNLQFQI